MAEACTGVVARHCPRHGECTCPENPWVPDPDVAQYAQRWEPAPGCPLHDPSSNHPLQQ